VSGLVVAVAIATLARRARLLSTSGGVAATLVGTAAVAAGWDWGAMLIAFFLTSSLLSRVGRQTKVAASAGMLGKGDQRDAVQVLANGALFALAAVGFAAVPSLTWQAFGGGALAAATSDTWSTEIGMLAPRPPRSIVTLQPVSPGASGGVTLLGLFGGVLGAAFVEMTAVLLRWPWQAAGAALAGGIVGSLADSLLGALVQQRRWCDRCGKETERRVHVCGAPTRVVGGLPWLDNDGVNVICALAGGAVAVLVVGRL